MNNPFDESSQQPSMDELHPICFEDSTPTNNKREDLFSPINHIDLDRLSEKATNRDVGENELRTSLQQAQQLLREMKSYSESLQHRNLQMVLQLEKERMKNKQLLSALSFIKNQEAEKKHTLEFKIQENSLLTSQCMIQKNRGELLENQVRSLRLENGYLKELMLIANDNYEKLEASNKEIISRCCTLEQQRNNRQLQMLKKTEEIKSMFATIVVEKYQGDNKLNVKKEDFLNTNASINLGTLKSVRKQPVDDAYRQIFMKTLKPRKQNRVGQ